MVSKKAPLPDIAKINRDLVRLEEAMKFLEFAAESIELARDAIESGRRIALQIEDPALRLKVAKAAGELKADSGTFLA